MRSRSIILTLALCLLSWAANAQPIQGFYVSGAGGLLLPFPVKNSPMVPGIVGDYDIKQKPGPDLQLSVGYALGDGWRFEVEGSYGRARVNGFEDTAFTAAGSGTVRNLGFMANALFDLDIGSRYVFPYTGLGAGYQSTHLDSFSLTGTSKPLTFSASGQTGGFAVQAIAGLSFPIPNMPGLSLTADYRIMDILSAETFNGAASFGPGSASVASATKFHNQFDQILMFGVRYAFNTPPPAAPAATAVPPSSHLQPYRVSFEPGDASLNERAQGVVTQVAGAGGRATRIEVIGGSASGVATRDQELSGQRAKAVAAALVSAGVPKDGIVITPHWGTSHGGGTLAAGGNRWVEIVAE
jgi:outer membrane protein OmpA-like peptidoglycan-associated protein